MVSNAILQGTISEVTGGKFSNGAMTAAFRVAFNDSLNDWDARFNPEVKKYVPEYEGSNPFPDMHEGALSVPEDYFRVIWHYESLNGDYGLDSMLYAMSADIAVTSALGSYYNDEHFDLNGKTYSVREEVNSLFWEQVGNNKAFFVGRSSYSLGQSLLLSRIGVKFSGTASVGVPAFSVATFGRALNLYDQGVRYPINLVSGALSGKQ